MTCRFSPGALRITPAALDEIPAPDIRAALRRHLSGDWGDLDEHDKRENDFSLTRRLRLLSAYRTGSGRRFWVITEADRSQTTLLLPEEY